MLRYTGRIEIADDRRLLVERVAASSYLNRSVRLRALLHYLTERVIEDETCEIREHEVGHKVFGRPIDYDTTADNIVRVHASMLRKRLEQYFSTEGADEPWILEIPKGNYAPIFHERQKAVVEPAAVEPAAPDPPDLPPAPPLPPAVSQRLVRALTGLTLLFAGSTAWLLFRGPHVQSQPASHPVVRSFWSRIFNPGRATDIVMDDSALALYQELTGKSVALSEYFDRSYLRAVSDSVNSTLLLRRLCSYASTSFYWKLTQAPDLDHSRMLVRYARDYSFRELKANNSILIGNGHTNPWVQPFETRLAIRWQYEQGSYYPVDERDPTHPFHRTNSADAHEGYCSIAVLPNLGGTGNVLIVAATGGSALNAAADFLSDEAALSGLQARLGAAGKPSFPPFETLIRLTGRSTLPRDAAIVVCRKL